jgi:hypothetical protein
MGWNHECEKKSIMKAQVFEQATQDRVFPLHLLLRQLTGAYEMQASIKTIQRGSTGIPEWFLRPVYLMHMSYLGPHLPHSFLGTSNMAQFAGCVDTFRGYTGDLWCLVYIDWARIEL